MDRNNKGQFLLGNKVAKKADHRCAWCGKELTKKQINKKAKFDKPSCRVYSYLYVKKTYGISVKKTG